MAIEKNVVDNSDYGARDSGFASKRQQQHAMHSRKCPFSEDESLKIDYKDVRVLSRFLSERGKIIPSRVTAVCFKKQRELSRAIKRARFLALIPYVND
jgi:small subunit ribosomal protein S18